jgi:hypothetical protein
MIWLGAVPPGNMKEGYLVVYLDGDEVAKLYPTSEEAAWQLIRRAADTVRLVEKVAARYQQEREE